MKCEERVHIVDDSDVMSLSDKCARETLHRDCIATEIIRRIESGDEAEAELVHKSVDLLEASEPFIATS